VDPERPVEAWGMWADNVSEVSYLPVWTFMNCRITQVYSLDGEIKLFDIRGADIAVATWNIHPGGLSAFDVHLRAEVFAS
jgi:hypothetical protein